MAARAWSTAEAALGTLANHQAPTLGPLAPRKCRSSPQGGAPACTAHHLLLWHLGHRRRVGGGLAARVAQARTDASGRVDVGDGLQGWGWSVRQLLWAAAWRACGSSFAGARRPPQARGVTKPARPALNGLAPACPCGGGPAAWTAWLGGGVAREGLWEGTGRLVCVGSACLKL